MASPCRHAEINETGDQIKDKNITFIYSNSQNSPNVKYILKCIT